MPWSVEVVESLFRERRLAWTPQRRAIVRHLAERGGHWSAAALLAELSGELPRASRATVYSTLSLLRELGVVAALPGPQGELRFDANPEPHQHFLCQGCGRLEDLAAQAVEVRIRPGEGADGLRVTRFRVVAEGHCPSCGPDDGTAR